MLTYHYVARNPATGKQVRAEVQADSEQAAARLISQEGLVPTQITLNDKGVGGLAGLSALKNRVPIKDKVLFSRQLSTLINAGLPLLQALRSVYQQTTSKGLKIVLSQVIGDVEGGATLSGAMGKHPEVFNQLYVSLIGAGEASGTLDGALERLALQQEKDADLQSKVRGAMTYPVIVLFVMGGVVGFMVVKVLPQVSTLYSGIKGATLPLLTRVLLGFSHFLINFWWVVLVAIVLLAFFGSRWIRTTAGRRVTDKMKMRAWPIGPLFMKMYMARFARTGSTLIGSGVPLLQMLEITGNAVDNMYLKKSIDDAIGQVRVGKSLADSIEKDENFLPLVPNMLRIGEQSGAIEEMMTKVADYYEKEVDNEIANVSSIIEPVMMVLLGVVALIIVAAVLLPIYGLAGNSGFTGS